MRYENPQNFNFKIPFLRKIWKEKDDSKQLFFSELTRPILNNKIYVLKITLDNLKKKLMNFSNKKLTIKINLRNGATRCLGSRWMNGDWGPFFKGRLHFAYSCIVSRVYHEESAVRLYIFLIFNIFYVQCAVFIDHFR